MSSCGHLKKLQNKLLKIKEEEKANNKPGIIVPPAAVKASKRALLASQQNERKHMINAFGGDLLALRSDASFESRSGVEENRLRSADMVTDGRPIITLNTNNISNINQRVNTAEKVSQPNSSLYSKLNACFEDSTMNSGGPISSNATNSNF